jgi:hypothetical protein
MHNQMPAHILMRSAMRVTVECSGTLSRCFTKLKSHRTNSAGMVALKLTVLKCRAKRSKFHDICRSK